MDDPERSAVHVASGRSGIPESLTSVKWYANVDDCIGGWQVSNVDKPASQLDTRRDSGEYAVALFLNEDVARHIVALHNADIGQHE